MSDNLTTPVASGSILATDDVAGIQYPRVKISFGVDGAAADVNSGSRFPVDVGTSIAVTQSGAWNIANITGTITLPTGAATSALQTTGNTSLASIATLLGGTLAISAAALPLPAGAATAANQGTGNTSLAAIAASVAAAEPAKVYAPVTLGATNFTQGTARYFTAVTAGYVKLKQPDGTVRDNFYLFAGMNAVEALSCDTATSTPAAAGIWAYF